jgi:hypothetical protein
MDWYRYLESPWLAEEHNRSENIPHLSLCTLHTSPTTVPGPIETAHTESATDHGPGTGRPTRAAESQWE